MRPAAKRILAVVLAAAMVCPLASCRRKKKPQKTIIQESDPYFDAHVTELDIPLESESDKTISYKGISDEEFIGDKIVAPYSVSYEIPEDIWDAFDEEDLTQEEIENVMRYIDEFYVNGVAIFNLNGELLSTIEIGDEYQVACIGEGRDGSILMVQVVYIYSESEDMNNTQYTLCKYDDEGNQIFNIHIPDAMDFYPNYVCELDNGMFALSSNGALFVMTDDGKEVGLVENDEIQGTLFPCGEELYASVMRSDPETSLFGSYLVKVDLEKVDLTNANIRLEGVYTICPDGKDGGIVITASGMEHLDLHSGKLSEVLKWDSTDVNYSNITSIRMYSEDHVAFMREVWKAEDESGEWNERVYISELRRAQSNPHAGKTYIELGMTGAPGYALVDYINSYNAEPGNKARIRIRDYAVNTGEMVSLTDVNAASEKMYQDILSGTGPDILVDFSGYSQFNSEDVLVDLNTFIDGENGLNREEYFDNVLSAFETRDKLFHVPICFDIRGLLGNMKMVGSRSGWTYPEFSHIAENLDPEVMVLTPMTYGLLLESLLSCAMNNFVDYEKREVFFDGDEFRQLLQIVKEYGSENVEMPVIPEGEEFFESGYYYFPNYNDVEMMEAGMLALMDTYVYRLEQYAINSSILNGRVVYVGMPSPDGTGMMAAPMLTMAISAFSDSKEEAWDFIRRMFDEDSQYEYTTSYTSIPLNRKAFDRANEAAVRQSEWEYKQYEENALRYGVDVAEMPIRITSEHVEGFLGLVESVSTIVSVDPAVLAIIQEEAAGYFADQKSLDDVCRNIQNRTTTIVNERK